MTVFEDLKWRGLVNDITSPDVEEAINNGGLKFYIGVDPTGDSLHIGHYCTVIATAKRLMNAGHTPVIIAGGGTGLIGDPKPNVERPMISKEAVKHNISCIQKQVSEFLKGDIEIVNNADWLLEMNAIDFLRDYGKHFNINYMLAKDTVKRRLDIGITYTEFSYMILQSIDFLKLYEKYGVTMQIGGQDQWGNITSGLELIRKIHGDVKCYGFTVPLVTRADGTKFGKSESGEALWLDKTKTSSYGLYQYFINTEDVKVIEYLKKLTFLSREEIEAIEEQQKEMPEKRIAQKKLAEEIITFLHGKEEYEHALKISESLFSDKVTELSSEDIISSLKGVPTIQVELNVNILDFVVNNGIVSSKREAREFASAGAISLNNRKITDLD
ncbi:MAG: tyrosine--tRNA ligase, partial [Bacilli bacterium]|nr:tyrosine--tRNA ligase [Bacilli bacterium]